MTWLDLEAIEHISYGASVLASGGGGDPYIGKIMAQQAIQQHGPIRLLDSEVFQTHELLLSTGMIGSPTVMVEKIPNGEESIVACQCMEKHLGRTIAGIYPIEAGGINSLLPLATACRLGLPVVDVDGMGRAFPEFQMTTFYLDGINVSTFIIADEKLNTVLVDAIDSHQAEKFARAVTVKMGGAAIFAASPISPTQARNSGIKGTISFMRHIGKRMEQARAARENLVDTLVGLLRGHVLFRGKAIRVNQRSEDGFTRGIAIFTGVDENVGGRFEVLFQNEYLLAKQEEIPLCITPDLIILLDEDTGLPVLAERLSYGMRVVVIGAPADDKWRTSRGIEVCGPGYFNYPDDYKPVEMLAMAPKGAI
ncbi:DUF917 family protein [Candidatus Hamiltonella defensa]|uniref:Uncharacterized protein n=1 Tax=Candidatus Williamhamiltonella defendens TaxID=138072 RepID=A0A4P2SM13_9ENTR|nr:DUF917 domain-containing protein [Candidatus Hamiltonella defensa]ASV32915.1 hypothetical protein CJJ18_00820 [Candidatus Hamiltonella defensa]AWK15870.1 hypothetical protein CCS40_00820 [Candidatus Hamiltonella defensa]AYB49142.1 hypothetical protein CJJ19_06135 [Candidatus Hamiltonella defensa]MBK4361041.1 DUF917 family protein [Candidatus Hamiltonella defensa]